MVDPAHRIVRLFDSILPSGNAYKVHLLLHMVEAPPYQTVDLDILASPSQTRTPAFLQKNPNGRIPVVELANGTFLAESNAIMCFAAEGTPLLPSEPVARAQVLQWLFFEQYSHERFVAVLKFWTCWGGLESRGVDEVNVWRTQGQAAIDVMERHLRSGPYFVGQACTVADLALFAYTQSAKALGYTVGPEVRAWLARVAGQPRWIAIKPDPLGKAP